MKVIHKLVSPLNDLGQRAMVWAMTRHHDFMSSDQRHIYLASAAVTTCLLTFAGSCYADGGFAGMADTGAKQADSAAKSGAVFFKAVGFLLAGYGGFNLIKKGKDKHSDVTTKSILFPIVGGAMLGATGFMLARGGETVGIGVSSQGQLPN